MKLLLVACSVKGYELTKKVEELFPGEELHRIVKCSGMPELTEERPLTECIGEWFEKVDGILFVCAAGIAVRSIAPFIRHKSRDPAVLVMDETGSFCISLLSGHAGGANALAERIGKMTGALPVITTATDREGCFAVDVFAGENGLTLTDWNGAKSISARILRGERIRLESELDITGELPEGLERVASGGELLISWRKNKGGAALQLYPRVLALGIGCKKNTSADAILAAVRSYLTENELAQEAVCCVASIDLKAQEEGILQLARSLEVPFLTFSAEELSNLKGEYTSSSFVEQVTGVANVCERSAVMAAGGTYACLVGRKKAFVGVTVAAALREGVVRFG